MELARNEWFFNQTFKMDKGNKMGFAGLKDEKDRASVMLYLNQSSDQPKKSTNCSKQYIKILF